jgi:hypothetical protein
VSLELSKNVCEATPDSENFKANKIYEKKVP